MYNNSRSNSRRTKTDNRGNPYIMNNLYPSKMGGSTLGKTVVELGGKAYSVIVFDKAGETRSGKPTVGFVKFTLLPKRQNHQGGI